MAALQPRWLCVSFTALVLLALAMMSCGGDSDAGPPATPTITPTATGAGFLATWTPHSMPAVGSATPVVVAGLEAALYLEHPAGTLVWEGPDRRVSSVASDHCSARHDEFGVPGHIRVEDGLGFWGGTAVPFQPAWNWTGYFHGDWQIWQGDDPVRVYVLNVKQPVIAFEYRWFGCR